MIPFLPSNMLVLFYYIYQVEVLSFYRKMASSSAFKSQDAEKAAEMLFDQITTLKQELREIQSNCPNQLQLDEHQMTDNLEKEVVELASEARVLKKSAPEGNMDDPTIGYYLAIAELEKNNGILRQQKQITEENLKSLVKDLEGAKNLSSEMKQIKGVLENMNSGDNQENNLNAPNKEESVTDIENKIRGTRKVYKELKNFLGEFLTRIDPVQKGGFAGGNLGNLLQTLWNDFQDGDDKQYTKMSFLEFDVEKSHVDLLVKNGIAQLDPNDADNIRLVDFTE